MINLLRIKQLGLVLLPTLICWYALMACISNPYPDMESARKTIVEWCRLADFPEARVDETIKISGSEFTRQFEVTFRLDATELASWVDAGPGLQDAEKTIQSDEIIYLIQPSKAQFGMVRINKTTGEVYIKTYWS